MYVLSLLTITILLAHIFPISGYYVPANGDDWTKLKPNCEPLEGSFDTIPFVFGIVVNPYFINEEGELEEPPISSIERSVTTSFITSIVTAAPKPTKTKDLIHQIHDGQVQKVKSKEDFDVEAAAEVAPPPPPQLLKRSHHEADDIVVGQDLNYDDRIDSLEEIYEDIGGENKNRENRYKIQRGSRIDKKRPFEDDDKDSHRYHDDERDNHRYHDGKDRENHRYHDGDDKNNNRYRDGDDKNNNRYRDGDDKNNNRYRDGDDKNNNRYRDGDDNHKHYDDKNKDNNRYRDGDDNHKHYDDKDKDNHRHQDDDNYHKYPHEEDHHRYYPDHEEEEFISPVYAVACYGNSTLRMTLKDGILRDSDNRIGSIVSGHQFQFDGPTPQHGAVYAAGWSITKDGQLALGDSTKFFQCASGNFYNLYDEPIGYQCHPVTLDVVELIEC